MMKIQKHLRVQGSVGMLREHRTFQNFVLARGTDGASHTDSSTSQMGSCLEYYRKNSGGSDGDSGGILGAFVTCEDGAPAGTCSTLSLSSPDRAVHLVTLSGCVCVGRGGVGLGGSGPGVRWGAVDWGGRGSLL